MEFCQLVCRSLANKINRRSRVPREGTKYRCRLITGKVRTPPLYPVTRIVRRFNRLRTHAKEICPDIPICRNLSFPPFFDRLALIGPRCAYSRRENSPPGFTFDTLRGKLNLLSKWIKWIKFRNLGTWKISPSLRLAEKSRGAWANCDTLDCSRNILLT